ncbi:MAG TPA: hypothetical protein VGN72_13890 [Tepidisphaeraceae bacterium]|jgi:flagellar biosynthesis/type III secretory pathway M-ring protein FliF/YscJ|nr:hypothetical protein [Tepidisphaeraceae bacterium]
MEFLKSQVARIGQQLNGLNASQKMLAGALVVIMVMTLLYSARFAGVAELTPLLDQPLTQEEIVRITSTLDGGAINYQVAGDKILIPTDRKYQVIALLGFEQKLPSNTVAGFDQMVKQMSPWDSQSMTETKFNEYRATTLGQIIREFPGVRSAMVLVDVNKKRIIGQSSPSSATVQITTNNPGQQANKKMVEAAAAVVAGAHAGMQRANIVVVVDGVSQRVGDASDEAGLSGSDILDAIAASERFYTRKIMGQIDFMDPKVSVTVELETNFSRERTQEYDAKKTFTKPLEEKTRTDESETTTPTIAEPGAVPNTSMSLAGPASGGGTSTSTNEENTKHAQYPTLREANTVKPAGKATVVAASVRVPRSYFAKIWMAANPGGKEPTDAVIEAMANAEFPKIRADVMMCTNLKDPESVSVEIYTDALPILTNGGAQLAATGTGSLAAGVGSYAKEIAIGVLALVSLFMVTSLVKKSTPTTVTLGPIEADLPTQFPPGELMAGEASESEQLLDGMELDDDAVRAQQMLDQVSNMVKENPEGAASLVKRWMNRT